MYACHRRNSLHPHAAQNGFNPQHYPDVFLVIRKIKRLILQRRPSTKRIHVQRDTRHFESLYTKKGAGEGGEGHAGRWYLFVF